MVGAPLVAAVGAAMAVPEETGMMAGVPFEEAAGDREEEGKGRGEGG